MAELKARHAFGSEANVDTALEAGTIDAYDILFLDEKKIGWIDKNGGKVILEDKEYVMVVEELPTENGDSSVIYIYNNEAYIWNGTECVTIAQSADVTELTESVDTLSSSVSELQDKVSTLEEAEAEIEIIEF